MPSRSLSICLIGRPFVPEAATATLRTKGFLFIFLAAFNAHRDHLFGFFRLNNPGVNVMCSVGLNKIAVKVTAGCLGNVAEIIDVTIIRYGNQHVRIRTENAAVGYIFGGVLRGVSVGYFIH